MRPYADIDDVFHCPECGAVIDYDDTDPLCWGACEDCGWEEIKEDDQ